MGVQIILIVDDEILVRMMLGDILCEAGYEVMEAASADEGLLILEARQDYDLMITDVRMPGEIDGLELMGHSKRLYPQRPVVVSSGHLPPEAARPADAFLPKPYVEA